MELMECICVETALPFFKDVSNGALYTTGRSAEYFFWLEFFKNSDTLLREFKRRVAEEGRFIRWDFIRPEDNNLRQMSGPQQYREALDFVRDYLKETSRHLVKTYENLSLLEQGAS